MKYYTYMFIRKMSNGWKYLFHFLIKIYFNDSVKERVVAVKERIGRKD